MEGKGEGAVDHRCDLTGVLQINYVAMAEDVSCPLRVEV
jgi:hypothetical protein